MRTQKQKIIPTVSNVPITEWNAATSFTSDFIEFPESKEWLLDFQDYANMTAGTPTITILHSNSQDGEYKPYSTQATNVDVTAEINRTIYDDHFFARYMKIQYVSGGSTGDFSLILSK